MRLGFPLALTALLGTACIRPEPAPRAAIQVQVLSIPGKASLFLGGKPLGETPQALAVGTADELLAMTAVSGDEPPVEKRIRFLGMDRVEVTFVFGSDRSAMAKALGFARILVFDYGSGVTFALDKSELKPEFLPLLERQAALLQTHFPDQTAFLCGHTDTLGSDEHNLALSLDRARAVADDLAARGVPRTRLKIEGFGSTYPLATNDTEEGRAMNRRTEIILPQ